jgi:hypothetical protein
MKIANIKIVIITLLTAVGLVLAVNAAQVASSKKSCPWAQSELRETVSRQQYQSLLHDLYGMEYNLNKIKNNKKYFLLRSQVRRLLSALKCNYKYHVLNKKKFNTIEKKSKKVDNEIQRLISKAA